MKATKKNQVTPVGQALPKIIAYKVICTAGIVGELQVATHAEAMALSNLLAKGHVSSQGVGISIRPVYEAK